MPILRERMPLGQLGTLLCALTVLGTAWPANAAVIYNVTVDTSSVNGSLGYLDFQFDPGNGTSQAATALVSNFSGGTLGAVEISGDVTGTLPGTLTMMNDTALNEYFVAFTYASSFSFQLSLSGPAISSPNGTSNAGTEFGLGLYDPNQDPILTNQEAATGFAGQVDINLNGSTTPTAFPSNDAGAASVVTFQAQAVPEPATAFLALMGIAGLGLFGAVRGKGRRAAKATRASL